MRKSEHLALLVQTAVLARVVTERQAMDVVNRALLADESQLGDGAGLLDEAVALLAWIFEDGPKPRWTK